MEETVFRCEEEVGGLIRVHNTGKRGNLEEISRAMVAEYISIIKGEKGIPYVECPRVVKISEEQKTMETVQIGDVLQGVVKNIVAFGAFVDVSLGTDALLHQSKIRKQLVVNQRVDVKIVQMEKRGGKTRISIELA